MAPVSRRAVLAGLFLSPLILSGGGLAQPVISPVKLDIFRQSPKSHRLAQTDLTNGENSTWRIFSACPDKPPPKDGFSILYMLDGNAVFDLLTPEILAQAPDLIIVGIGYDTDLRFDVTRRAFDYTPPGSQDLRAHIGRKMGGADLFLKTMQNELFPAVEKNAPVNSERRFIWGHSYGGVFSLYALFANLVPFHGFASISPSINVIAPMLDSWFEKARWKNQTPVFAALGDNERRSDQRSDSHAPSGPAKGAVDLIGRLEANPFLSVRKHVLKGLGHGATFAASIPLVIDWVKENA